MAGVARDGGPYFGERTRPAENRRACQPRTNYLTVRAFDQSAGRRLEQPTAVLPRPSEEVFFQRLRNRSRAGVHLEFRVNVAQMRIDGVEAEAEAVCDFLLDQAFDREVEDLAFARGQP